MAPMLMISSSSSVRVVAGAPLTSKTVSTPPVRPILFKPAGTLLVVRWPDHILRDKHCGVERVVHQWCTPPHRQLSLDTFAQCAGWCACRPAATSRPTLISTRHWPAWRTRHVWTVCDPVAGCNTSINSLKRQTTSLPSSAGAWPGSRCFSLQSGSSTCQASTLYVVLLVQSPCTTMHHTVAGLSHPAAWVDHAALPGGAVLCRRCRPGQGRWRGSGACGGVVVVASVTLVCTDGGDEQAARPGEEMKVSLMLEESYCEMLCSS